MNTMLTASLMLFSCSIAARAETLPPLKDGRTPETFEELWSGFDPRKEPLDVAFVWTDLDRRGVSTNVDDVNGNYSGNRWLFLLSISN